MFKELEFWRKLAQRLQFRETGIAELFVRGKKYSISIDEKPLYLYYQKANGGYIAEYLGSRNIKRKIKKGKWGTAINGIKK